MLIFPTADSEVFALTAHGADQTAAGLLSLHAVALIALSESSAPR
jgi:hypothetical protein